MTASVSFDEGQGAREPRYASFAGLVEKGELHAVRARYAGTNFGSSGEYIAETFGRTPAYLCVLQLRDFPATDGWCDERDRRLPALLARSAQIYDLRQAWRTDVRHPFDNVHIHVTQAMLDRIAAEAGLDSVELGVPPVGGDLMDPTLWHLAMALLPAFGRPGEVSRLFAETISTAAALHLVHAYGTARMRGEGRRGLTPWQYRRAVDLLRASLDRDIGLDELAAACGLSPGHFGKAFKISAGLPPHRWLLRERIRRAQELLREPHVPISEVALACGFVDQSHLTRVFVKAIGIGPAAWRRLVRS